MTSKKRLELFAPLGSTKGRIHLASFQAQSQRAHQKMQWPSVNLVPRVFHLLALAGASQFRAGRSRFSR